MLEAFKMTIWQNVQKMLFIGWYNLLEAIIAAILSIRIEIVVIAYVTITHLEYLKR